MSPLRNSRSRSAASSTGKRRPCAPSSARQAGLIVCALALIALAGCQASSNGGGLTALIGGQKHDTGLPRRHSVTAEQLVVMSDLKLGGHHPLVEELKVLRNQVHDTLQLTEEEDGEKVTVYLFSNEMEYRKYIQDTYPGLPFRRAYFIGTPEKLAVYTFWGDKIREDLRHEYTHGLLHASLRTVPLWLDEGLAEYFEVPGAQPGTVNNEYAVRLARAVQSGWRPDIHRLERLEKVEQMHRADYRESWAWVHFMLHNTPDGKQVLLDYLQSLRDTDHPASLSSSLIAALPEVDARFLNYVATLNTYRQWLSTPSPEQFIGQKRREIISRANAP